MRKDSLVIGFALGLLVATPEGRAYLMSLADEKAASAQKAEKGKRNLFRRVWLAILDKKPDEKSA